METQGAKNKEESQIGCLITPIVIVLFIISFYICCMFFEDVQSYTAPDVSTWIEFVCLPLGMLFALIRGRAISKDKQERIWPLVWKTYSILLTFLLPIFVFSTFLWINYIGSDPMTRHEELVTVEKHKGRRSVGVDMTVRFEDGWERTVEIKEYDIDTTLPVESAFTYYWEKYKIGTTLPVTIERGLFGIDVIVEWGFENDEHTVLLPDLEEKDQ